MKNNALKLLEHEEEGTGNLNQDLKMVDVLNTINDVENKKHNNLNENIRANILNSYNLVFILNDDNFVILYEPQANENFKSIEKSLSQEKINSKLSTRELKIELVPMFDLGFDKSNNSLKPEERIAIGPEYEKEEINNFADTSNELTAQKSNFSDNMQENIVQYGTNNMKIKLSYNQGENVNKSIFEDKTSNISSNLITAGNLGAGNFYSEIGMLKNEDKGSLDEEYSKELFTENATNDEIFENTFNFEQSIEELRNYINLVGISLLE